MILVLSAMAYETVFRVITDTESANEAEYRNTAHRALLSYEQIPLFW